METRQHFLYLLCNVTGKSEWKIKKHIAGFVRFSRGKPVHVFIYLLIYHLFVNLKVYTFTPL